MSDVRVSSAQVGNKQHHAGTRLLRCGCRVRDTGIIIIVHNNRLSRTCSAIGTDVFRVGSLVLTVANSELSHGNTMESSGDPKRCTSTRPAAAEMWRRRAAGKRGTGLRQSSNSSSSSNSSTTTTPTTTTIATTATPLNRNKINALPPRRCIYRCFNPRGGAATHRRTFHLQEVGFALSCGASFRWWRGRCLGIIVEHRQKRVEPAAARSSPREGAGSAGVPAMTQDSSGSSTHPRTHFR